MSTLESGPSDAKSGMRTAPVPAEPTASALEYRSPPPNAPGRSRSTSGRWVALLAIMLISVGFLMPFVWMVSTSLKKTENAAEFPPRLVPQEPQWGNYEHVAFHSPMDFPLYTRNTLIIAALAVIGTTLSSAIVAYGFAKIPFKGRGVLFAIMLSTMMIPFPVLMVSLFSIFRWMGDHTPIQMLGTFKPLWLPAWFGSAFSIFLLRQFFRTIPDELSDAARIDGCTEWGIFWRIVLPLSRPALSVVALFTFMWAWNNFLGPLIYLTRPEQYTLTLGLQAFQSQQGGTEWNYMMAASMMVICPVILLFFLTQKTFIQGIATTGLK